MSGYGVKLIVDFDNQFFVLLHGWTGFIFYTLSDVKRIMDFVWCWATMLFLRPWSLKGFRVIGNLLGVFYEEDEL